MTTVLGEPGLSGLAPAPEHVTPAGSGLTPASEHITAVGFGLAPARQVVRAAAEAELWSLTDRQLASAARTA